MLILDPYIFTLRTGESASEYISRVKRKLQNLIYICRTHRLKLVADATGWKELELNLISKIKDPSGNPELATSLSILRRKFLDQRTPFQLTGGRTWGIGPLFFNFASLEDAKYGDFVAKSIGHAMQSGFQQIYLFVDSRIGRNLHQHGNAPSIVVERTRWRIYVAYSGYAVAKIPCITSALNISVPWTCRFDESLPHTGTFAFAPPNFWELIKTAVIGTRQSKAVWLDELGNGWSRPGTPGVPEHWDVYLQPIWKDKLKTKLDQVNITKNGIKGRISGEIHHVPTGKSHLLSKGKG